MRKHWPFVVVLLVALAVIAPCLWSLGRREHRGGLERVDFGDGRVVDFWSQSGFGDPPFVCFQAELHGRPLHHPVCRGLFRPPYRVRTWWLGDRPVSATVAECDDHRLAVYVDWDAGRVWRWDDTDPDIWRDRYRELRKQHPDMPADPDFE